MVEKKEHSFSKKNANSFQPEPGVENLFKDAASLACKNNCIPIFDEENLELNKKRYTPEYEIVTEMFGGYGFNIRYWT